MNQEITAPQLRVVTPNPKGKDEALGIMTREEAFLKAKELGDLDLIIINENSDPPVCKIVDYSKYRYSQEKKAKEVKKNSKTSELKEVKMSYKIDVHDYDVRKKSAYKFLRAGNRVKCTVTFRGREVQHDKLGFELLEKLASELEDTCIKEGNPKKEGRNFLSLILTPRPEVMKAININRRAQDKAKKQKKVQTNDDDDDDDEDDDDDAPEDVVEGTTAPKAGEKKIKVEKTLEEILGTDEYL
jgi:translation initiation factor IF-3